MQTTNIDHPDIKGWGVDADPKNDPTYPMKHRNDGEHHGRNWERPPLQPVDVEVYHSIERPDLTAVFGTAEPPSGLSGKIRKLAFKKGESNYGHWLPLMLADRINMVEGIIDDFRHGHVPNLFSERGWGAEWKYNRKKVVQRAILGTVVTSIAVAYFRKNRRHPAGRSF